MTKKTKSAPAHVAESEEERTTPAETAAETTKGTKKTASKSVKTKQKDAEKEAAPAKGKEKKAPAAKNRKKTIDEITSMMSNKSLDQNPNNDKGSDRITDPIDASGI